MNYNKQNDISTAFSQKRLTRNDVEFKDHIIEIAETPEAFDYFIHHRSMLSDYTYWFFLSTLWVDYTGYSDLRDWKDMFSSKRPNKEISLMKPSELKAFHDLPNKVIAYRVHRPNETDWIAYTLSLEVALRFARERNADKISVYRIKKRDILALFLRRGEHEIIVLDKEQSKLIDNIGLLREV